MLSIAYYWPIQEAYHPLNTGWNGCSRIANTAKNTTLLFSYNKPLPNETSLLAIIGPSTDFSGAESSDIQGFLRGGGTVLLADDFGTGNSLLEALNISARFTEKPLADLYYYSQASDFPLVADFSTSPVTENLTTIVLNRPTYIETENSSRILELASSSPFSFIDFSGENRPMANETIDSYPVMAEAKIGKGLLVLVADPSMFVNEMVELYDNMRLFQNLLRLGDGSLFIDVAHLTRAPLTDARTQLKAMVGSIISLSESNVILQFLVVAVVVVGFSFGIIRKARMKPAEKYGINLYTRISS
jgi:hypothetical protein